MYVLIDMEDMVIRHKHPDHSTVSSLAKIELSHTRAKVIPLDTGALNVLTDMEVRLLHTHVTGVKMGPAPLHRLAVELFDALKGLPDSVVNVAEVFHQAKQISLKDSGFYRYVRGSYTPQRVESLFVPDAINVSTPAHVAPAVAAPQEAPKMVAQPLQTPAVLPAWHPANKGA